MSNPVSHEFENVGRAYLGGSAGWAAYTVIVDLPDVQTRKGYVQWLANDHLAKVIDGGAIGADVIEIDADRVAQVEIRYKFANMADLDVYLRDHAPKLRAEGLAKWGSVAGMSIRRTIGSAAICLARR
jgi:hypothetical protein